MKIEINGEEHWIAKTVTRRDVFVSLALFIDECKLPYALTMDDISDDVCSAYAADLRKGYINYLALLKRIFQG